MSVLADARSRLVAALDGALPGRVLAYPPPRLARGVAPLVWVDQPEIVETAIGERSTAHAVTFPVWLIYDGTIESQVAGLDDLLSSVWDAVRTVRGARPTSSRVDEFRTGDVSYRAAVVDAAVTVTASTFCVPSVSPAAIPPDRVLVSTT